MSACGYSNNDNKPAIDREDNQEQECQTLWCDLKKIYKKAKNRFGIFLKKVRGEMIKKLIASD